MEKRLYSFTIKELFVALPMSFDSEEKADYSQFVKKHYSGFMNEYFKRYPTAEQTEAHKAFQKYYKSMKRLQSVM